MFETVITYIVLPLLSISIFLIFLRLVKGPTIQDRVVAFDILSAVPIIGEY